MQIKSLFLSDSVICIFLPVYQLKYGKYLSSTFFYYDYFIPWPISDFKGFLSSSFNFDLLFFFLWHTLLHENHLCLRGQSHVICTVPGVLIFLLCFVYICISLETVCHMPLLLDQFPPKFYLFLLTHASMHLFGDLKIFISLLNRLLNNHVHDV